MKKINSIRLVNRTLNEGQFTWAIRFLFVISIFLIVVLSISYHTINRELIYYSEKVDHTHQVLDKINEIKVAIHEVTYHGRGYFIMGDSINKNQMIQKIDLLPPLAYQLDTLLLDSETHVLAGKLIQDIEKYRERTYAFAQDAPLQYSEERKTTIMKNGTARTEGINELLDRMSKVETELMSTRVVSRNNYKQQVFRFNWVIMGVALAFLVSSFILLERELTRNKLYKIELENKVGNLNRSNSELEQFAYVASHDLQEPLRKIRSFTDLLIAKYIGSLPPEAGMLLGKVDKSATRMQLLIDDLLAFSRSIDSSLHPEEVNLNHVILEVKNNLSENIREKSAQIQCRDLPVLTGHRTQLVQLFQNLVSNSLKYSKAGVQPRIKISCSEIQGFDIPNAKISEENTTFYQILVQDNGIGFKKEYAEKIFVIFKRLHSHEKFQGSGIGLAICRKVVSNHSGYISADGEEGEGAKFFLYLPKQTKFT